MQGFNNGMSGRNGRGNAMGGNGMRLRDGSCQGRGSGQGKRMNLSPNGSARGLFSRFFTGGTPTNSASTASVADALRSAIEDLQRQIDELKGPSGK